MHLYEKTSPNRPLDLKTQCHSLPSRRAKKKRKELLMKQHSVDQPPASSAVTAARSMADLNNAVTPHGNMKEEEEILVQEVRQKLNALLLYKYQHSKATR